MSEKFQAAMSDDELIGQSVKNTFRELGITIADGAKIIGCSKATLDRAKGNVFSPDSKTGELSLMVIRIYRSMYALAGGDKDLIKHLLNTNNKILKVTPREAMNSIPGLVSVNEYYDAMRGKV